MERYLLDTHTAIWFFNDDTALSKNAAEIIRDLSNTVCMSMASIWELVIKISIKKLSFKGNAAGFIRLAQTNAITILPIKIAHLTILETLPFIHRDPFDRILVSTALADNMTLITSDGNIAKYDVPHIW